MAEHCFSGGVLWPSIFTFQLIYTKSAGVMFLFVHLPHFISFEILVYGMLRIAILLKIASEK